MNPATDPPVDPAPTSAEQRHRRTREEMEALAKNFIATPAADVPVKIQRRTNLAFAAGGIALAVLLLVVAWPEPEVQRPVADNSRAAAEAEQWRARFEAERERKRKELQAGGDYLAKMAAAESALLKEMGARASRLTAESEAPGPAPARRTAPVATASSAPVASQPQPAAAAKPEPEAGAEQKSTPAAPPDTVAAAPQCKLHVSQLSSTGTLTFEAIKGMKGARVDGSGHVLTPQVTLDDGRRVTFRVSPDGCVKWRRAS